MRVYLAGASSEIDLCESFIRKLQTAGLEITFDWTAVIRATAGGANPRDATENERHAWTVQDISGVRRSHVFWLLVPEKHSIGCWAELGVAYEARRRIVISGDWRKSIFTSLAYVALDTHDEAFEYLVAHAITSPP
jgi:hypothetical protein